MDGRVASMQSADVQRRTTCDDDDDDDDDDEDASLCGCLYGVIRSGKVCARTHVPCVIWLVLNILLYFH